MATTLDDDDLTTLATFTETLSTVCRSAGVSLTNALLWLPDAELVGTLDVGADGKVELRIGE